MGLQVVLYTLLFSGSWLAGIDQGFVGRAFSEALLSRESPFIPHIGWLVMMGEQCGLCEHTVLSMTLWFLLAAGWGLLLGVFSRPCAVLAWFLHLCAANSADLISYGVDSFMTIGLFYLMLAPLPDRFAFEHRWRARHKQDRQLPGFWRRVLQVHLCFIYFFSGLSKALGSGWWNGESLWRALTRPPFNLVPAEILIHGNYLFPVASISVLLLEVGYPLAIWWRRTRTTWLLCIIALHIGIGLAMGMYLFSLVMIILNVAAFGSGFLDKKEFARPETAHSVGPANFRQACLGSTNTTN